MAKAVKSGRGVSVVRRAAHSLRADVLDRADGSFLGSESDLVAALGVSRPTFRQAAKLLEQEQLLVIKRGVGGGFFARQPTTRAVAHVASVYLLARKATMEHAIRAARPLFADTARLAAQRRDRVSTAKLAAFLTDPDDITVIELREFLKSERDFLLIFSSLSGNPVLELYTAVLVDFAGTFVGTSVYSGHPERIAEYCMLRRGLIEAIIDGDEQVAQLLSHRRSDAIIKWVEDDMGKIQRSKGSNSRRAKQANRRLIGLSHDSRHPLGDEEHFTSDSLG